MPLIQAEYVATMTLPEAGFLLSYPVGAVYSTTSSSAPSVGTWTLLGTLNGVVLGSSSNVYYWRRDA